MVSTARLKMLAALPTISPIKAGNCCQLWMMVLSVPTATPSWTAQESSHFFAIQSRTLPAVCPRASSMSPTGLAAIWRARTVKVALKVSPKVTALSSTRFSCASVSPRPSVTSLG
ncbi:hypothetical protein D3C72_2143810 [compost metagenome]